MSAELRPQIRTAAFSPPPRFRYPNTNIINGFKTQTGEAQFYRADVGKSPAKAIQLLWKNNFTFFCGGNICTLQRYRSDWWCLWECGEQITSPWKVSHTLKGRKSWNLWRPSWMLPRYAVKCSPNLWKCSTSSLLNNYCKLHVFKGFKISAIYSLSINERMEHMAPSWFQFHTALLYRTVFPLKRHV